MRFVHLRMTGFAGVSRTAEVDLDANVIVLLAQNGFGKSTICDAMAWALTGKHPRGADPRSKYGSGETHVSLVLRETEGAEWSVRRMVTNPAEMNPRKLTTSVVLERNGRRVRGEEAEGWLVRRLLPQSDGTHRESLAKALTDGYYLQQDSLRDFLTSRSDDERFAALSQMVGAGNLSDLVRTVDSAKNSWARAITNSEHEISTLAATLRATEEEHAALSQEVTDAEDVLESGLAVWWRAARQLLGGDGPMEGDSPSESDVERVMRRLQQQLRRNDERRQVLLTAVEQLETLSDARRVEPPCPSGSEIAAARAQVTVSKQHLAEVSSLVRSVEASIQSARDERQELASMAALALRHVGDGCPACGRPMDRHELTARLESVISRAADNDDVEELASALAARSAAETRLSETHSELETLLEAEAGYQRWVSNERDRLARLSQLERDLTDALSVPSPTESIDEQLGLVQAAIKQVQQESVEVRDRLAEYDRLRSGMRLPSLRDSLEAARQTMSEARREYEAARRDIELRRFTHQQADLLVRALKSDSEDFLNQRLRDIQPVLDQLYAGIDPHPTLRNVKLETKNAHGKNRLTATLTDSVGEVVVRDPGTLLSTSQANAVAVCLFLAFNLGLKPTQLTAVVLDDPLQNLDDVHLLGLVDLLRRLPPYRQVVVTTHDPSFAAVLARKMRPVQPNERLHVVRIKKWDRAGPELAMEVVRSDPAPMKIAQ
jgi:DNA repair exonuclease SbcCD ATPase subunit